MGKVTGLNKLYTIAANETSNRIGKSAARSSVKATTEVAEPACSLLVFGAPICVAAVKVCRGKLCSRICLTYLPIVFFMNKAQNNRSRKLFLQCPVNQKTELIMFQSQL